MASPPPVLSDKSSFTTHMRETSISIRTLQTRNKENREPTVLKTLASRRDAIALITTSLAATFLSINQAEARTVKPETRRKIREKLDKLREKGGALKQKSDSSADDNGEKKKLPEFQNVLTGPPIINASF
ncbi:hypothetical protein QJS04_geneDACA002916 [Acorus gramineus]|uniref:Uncharacterized protein n=1 Tax=Acorus gramineus TaxID=55184 RepID=A0AAV9BZI7_ACOGR|nr:hypothetical protein QJS04_geneDACA002916 [Acorus gramineus]